MAVYAVATNLVPSADEAIACQGCGGKNALEIQIPPESTDV